MKLSLSWRRRRNDGNFGIYAHYASRGNARQPSNSLSMDENPRISRRTIMNVRQVEALAYREKPGLLILDHLGLLEPPEARLSLYEATTRNSRALKLLALRLNIPVLCLCQLNRAAASDRSGSFRATMANLRESGAIEQDADTVTLLHNPPCETGERMESPSLLELWLDKNRRGATGHVDATFYKVTGRVTA